MGKSWLQDDPNKVYCCYFHAGMRVFDVPGPMIATTEDCVVDDRGYIYMDTWHDDMYILRLKDGI